MQIKNVRWPTERGGEPGVWPEGGSIPSFLIFLFLFVLRQKERHSDSDTI